MLDTIPRPLPIPNVPPTFLLMGYFARQGQSQKSLPPARPALPAEARSGLGSRGSALAHLFGRWRKKGTSGIARLRTRAFVWPTTQERAFWDREAPHSRNCLADDARKGLLGSRGSALALSGLSSPGWRARPLRRGRPAVSQPHPETGQKKGRQPRAAHIRHPIKNVTASPLDPLLMVFIKHAQRAGRRNDTSENHPPAHPRIPPRHHYKTPHSPSGPNCRVGDFIDISDFRGAGQLRTRHRR